jgi:hypothetical protein
LNVSFGHEFVLEPLPPLRFGSNPIAKKDYDFFLVSRLRNANAIRNGDIARMPLSSV